MDYSGGVGTPIWHGRRRNDADGLVLRVGYLYSGVGGKGGGIRLHIAEFPKLVLAARGCFFNICRRHGGGPMTGTRAVASAFILATSLASVAFAQQPPKPAAPAQQPAKPAAPAAAAPAKPAAAQPAKPATTAAAPTGTAQPALLGQYGDWGAYAASPGGGKVCFALAKPKTTKIEPAGRKRDPSYVFVSTRPAENVKNEVSVIIGYPFKTSSDATAEVGAVKFAMYTQNDGAWIKNVAEEARMVDAMRKGADLTVKGTSGRGTASTDQYSLKGLAQALDKIEQECK
jgi:hypothetical protein